MIWVRRGEVSIVGGSDGSKSFEKCPLQTLLVFTASTWPLASCRQQRNQDVANRGRNTL
ncbi:Uncharacterised protein [Serratia quinivorans]|nr:Uncharacterised protein [Serratia quinivorans]CAI0902525.1 Uncharacterised protein [Serratia quinivorans]CAI1508315.1 Uncharacterised protein [Serratia quinivorans]CAI1595665.1 Uncharacterised protein [Serratia quinivorans]CAI2083711.1 Uncharacterised protein [Serratia quinivorans]